ncbi:MAG: ankyrin repeat domain-containing protein [Phycisphaerales bacterium]|nr:ankyrin repeat domain-containing protein [Phycisphaerales bacterium]
MHRLLTNSLCLGAIALAVALNGMSASALAQAAPEPPGKGDPVKPQPVKPQPVKPAPPVATPGKAGPAIPPGLVRPGAAGGSQAAVPTKPQVILAEPPAIELGEFSTSETKAGSVTLTNSSDEPVTVRSAKASCGCTTADFKRNTVLGPGESTEVTVRMKGGPTARVLNKTVTFTIDGYPQLKVPVKGKSILYVDMKPKKIGTELNPDGKIVLESIDGKPFKITSANPPVIDGITEEAKAKHEVHIDWDRFFDEARNARMTFYYDHPLCDQYYTIVALTREQRTALNEKIRGDKLKNGQGPQAGPKPPPVARNNDLASMVATGNVSGAKARLEAGESADATDGNGLSMLAIAGKEGNVEMIELLLDKGADVDVRDRVGRTPLMHAGTSRSPEAIRLFIDRGADVNARDSFIGGPLSWTSGFGTAESVQDLLDAGAQVETISGATGYTPLIWASGFGDPESVPMLLEAGANIEAKGSIEGNTALMHASKTGKIEAMRTLLEAGADKSARNSLGQTALLVSAAHPAGSREKIELLLDSGCDISAVDNSGRSVLDLAKARTDAGSAAVVALLEERMPKSE